MPEPVAAPLAGWAWKGYPSWHPLARESGECPHLWSHGYAEPCQREPGHDGVCHYNGPHAHPRIDQPCNPRCATDSGESGASDD